MKNLVIIGAGGHGRVILDIAQKLGIYNNISFLEDKEEMVGKGFSIVGKTTDMEKYISTADIFVAIGNSEIRAKFVETLLSKGASVPTLVHPGAIIGAHVEIGIGTAVMAGAVINPYTKVGRGSIVNTCSSLDHDCSVGDYCHISVGAHVAGEVSVGNYTWIGIGATVSNNISICENCIIGAGAVVVKDIIESGTYVGVPAKKK